MALFVSFEGGEGSGKSTQVERLGDALAGLGVPTLKLHEPGYTELGDHIRYLIKSKPWGGVTISSTAEIFLFAAARGELVSKVLSGKVKDPRLVIIADRYADSTVAYQGYGRRLPLEQVEAVNRLATGGLMPHKTFLLDCPPGRGLRRVDVQAHLFNDQDYRIEADSLDSWQLEEGRGSGNPLNPRNLDQDGARRFEDEPLSFHERVRAGYLEMAEREPERWEIVDALGSVDEVFGAIWGVIEGMDEFQRILSHAQDVPALLGSYDNGS